MGFDHREIPVQLRRRFAICARGRFIPMCGTERKHHEADLKFSQKPPFFKEIQRQPRLKRRLAATRVLENRGHFLLLLLFTFIIQKARYAKNGTSKFLIDVYTDYSPRLGYFYSELNMQRKSASNFSNLAFTALRLLSCC